LWQTANQNREYVAIACSKKRVCGHYTKAFQGSNWVALKPIVMEFGFRERTLRIQAANKRRIHIRGKI
jgi:hypothetical protein